VSHDRRFLDNVVTSTIVAEGEGRWREYEGGVEDWLAQSQRARGLQPPPTAAARESKAQQAAAAPAVPAAEAPARRTKLSYKEQRELEELPARIEALEAEQKVLSDELAGTELYTATPQRVPQVQARYAQIEDELMQLLERWEALAAR
jgi:ATP-binding cassette subfamily F protein uup